MLPTVAPDAPPAYAPVAAASRRHHRGLISLAVAVAVLVLAELVVRVAAPHLPEPLTWIRPEMQVKLDQMSRLSRGGATGGTVVVGSSLVDAGIDPADFPRRGGQGPVYNAGLAAVDIGSVAWWTTHEVIPKLHPSAVVIGINSREVNPNDQAQVNINQAFFASAPARAIDHDESVTQVLERRLDQASSIFRYRTVLRDPHLMLRGQQDPSVTALTGLGRNRFFSTAKISRQFGVSEIQSVLHNFRVSQQRLDVVAQLVRTLVASRIQVVVLDMPVSTTFVSLYPHGPADAQSYQQALAGTARSAGATFLTGEVWDDSLFSDLFHLNEAGAARFTSDLVNRLAGAGVRATGPPARNGSGPTP